MTAPAGAAVTVQDVIYAALANDAALKAWTGGTVRIYEVLAPSGVKLVKPDNVTPHPYLTLQGLEEVEFNTCCRPGFQTPFRVRVWVPGTRERLARVGAGHVRRVLDGAAFTLTGYVALHCAVERVRTEPEADASALQAMVDVRVWSEVSS